MYHKQGELLSLYFQNCASDFDDFCTDVRDIVALNNLASMLCARKFSFVPQGGFTPKKYPFLAKMVLFSLYLQNYASDFDDLMIKLCWSVHRNKKSYISGVSKVSLTLKGPILGDK